MLKLSLSLIFLFHLTYFFSALSFKAWLVVNFYWLFSFHLVLNGCSLIFEAKPVQFIHLWNLFFSLESLVYFVTRSRRQEILILDTVIVGLSTLILVSRNTK